MADQLGAGRDLALGHLGRDRIGVLDGDVRPCFRQLDRLLALLLGGHQDVGGLLAIGVGEHGVPRLLFWVLRITSETSWPGIARRKTRVNALVSRPSRSGWRGVSLSGTRGNESAFTRVFDALLPAGDSC